MRKFMNCIYESFTYFHAILPQTIAVCVAINTQIWSFFLHADELGVVVIFMNNINFRRRLVKFNSRVKDFHSKAPILNRRRHIPREHHFWDCIAFSPSLTVIKFSCEWKKWKIIKNYLYLGRKKLPKGKLE